MHNKFSYTENQQYTNNIQNIFSQCFCYLSCWVTPCAQMNWIPGLCLADLWSVQDSCLRASRLQRSDVGEYWRFEQPSWPLAPPRGSLCSGAGWCVGLLRASKLPWTPVPAGERRVPPLHWVGSHEPQRGVLPSSPELLDYLSFSSCFTVRFFGNLIKKDCAQYVYPSMFCFCVSPVNKAVVCITKKFWSN